MIKRSTKKIYGFIIILGVILLIEALNLILALAVDVKDDIGYNAIEMVFGVKLLAIVSLFVVLVIWQRNTDVKLDKTYVVTHTKYALLISMFYFLIIYLFKYSIVLDVMDIMRNKMIEGNPALLLNFAVHAYNKLKYVRNVFQNFNSELILMIQIFLLTWNLRNMMELEEVEEETVQYDSFLYNPSLKLISIALMVFSFISINLFEYIYSTLALSLMFMVAFFLFSLSIPVHYFTNRIANMNRKQPTPFRFKQYHKIVKIFSIIMMVGYVVLLGFSIYQSTLGEGTYRIFAVLISLALSSVLFIKVQNVLKLVN